MYQRWIYSEVQGLIPDCILKVIYNKYCGSTMTSYGDFFFFLVERFAGSRAVWHNGTSVDSFWWRYDFYNTIMDWGVVIIARLSSRWRGGRPQASYFILARTSEGYQGLQLRFYWLRESHQGWESANNAMGENGWSKWSVGIMDPSYKTCMEWIQGWTFGDTCPQW